MSDLTDMLVRAAGVSSVAGTVGASIGGSVTAVFGPAAAGGAAVGGLIGSAGGFVPICSVSAYLWDRGEPDTRENVMNGRSP